MAHLVELAVNEQHLHNIETKFYIWIALLPDILTGGLAQQ